MNFTPNYLLVSSPKVQITRSSQHGAQCSQEVTVYSNSDRQWTETEILRTKDKWNITSELLSAASKLLWVRAKKGGNGKTVKLPLQFNMSISTTKNLNYRLPNSEYRAPL